MSTELQSKEEFMSVTQQQGKYVFVLAYDGQAPAQADEMAKKFADMVSSYRFDISKAPGAKEAQGITETPCALVYKDGQRVAKADGMKPPSMQEISQMVSGSS